MTGSLLVVLLGVAGLAVWADVIRRWRQGEPALERQPRVPSPWLPYASLIAAIYISLWTFSGTDSDIVVTLDHVRLAILFGILEISIALTLLTGGFRTPFRDIGLRVTNFGNQLADGILAFLASFILVIGVLLATASLRSDETLHPYLKLLRGDPSILTFAWMVVSAVVIAPVKEELLFRVMLQDGLARRIGAPAAIGTVAVLFCLVHGFPDSLALFPLAVILGYLYEQRQSVLSVVITHALFNLTNLVMLLLSPDVLP